MRFKETTIAASAFALAVGATIYASAQTVPPSAAGDEAFIRQAQAGNDAEIAQARYLLTQTKNPQLRAYANELIVDHSTANVSLQRAARSAELPVPTAMRRTKMQAAPEALHGLSGTALDTAFVREQVADHKQMLAVLKAEENGGTDPALKAYALDQDPVVQKHLDQASNYIASGTISTPGPTADVTAPASPFASAAPSPITRPENGEVPTNPPGPVNPAAPPTHSP
jgi:putative membrane protein